MGLLRFYMAFILFINNFGRSLTITILPYYFLGNHLVWRDFSAIGIAISCFPLGSIVFSPLFGRLSDLWGRNRTLFLSFFALLLTYVLIYFAINIRIKLLLFLGLFFSGITDSCISISKTIICDHSTRKNKTHNLSFLEIGAGGGWVVGPFAGASIMNLTLSKFMYSGMPFLIIGGLYFVLCIVQYMVMTTKTESISYITRKKNKLNISISLASVLLIWFLFVFGVEIFLYVMPIFLIKVHQFSVLETGRLISFMGLVYLAVTFLLFIPLSKFVHKPVKVIIGSYLLQAISLLIVLKGYLYTGVCIFVLGQAFSIPSSIALISSQVSIDFRGFIIGLTSSIESVGILFVGLLILPLLTYSTSLPYLIGALLFFVSSLLAIGVIWRQSQSESKVV